LKVLQNLDQHLCIHDSVGLFVSQFAPDEEIGLTKLVDKRVERQSIVHVVLHGSQVRESFNSGLKEVLVVKGHAEVFDELGNSQDLQYFALVDRDSSSLSLTILRPVYTLVVVKVISELSTEHLEYFVKFCVQAPVDVDLFEDASGLNKCVLDQVELVHLVDFLRIGLRVTTRQVCVFALSFCATLTLVTLGIFK